MNPARSSWAPHQSGRGNLADVSTSTAAVADPAETPEHAAVRAAAQRAAAAAPGVRSAGGPAVDAALRTMAAALRDRTADLLAANTADVDAAERGGMTGGLLDRLRLTPERLADMAVQLEVLADTPEPPLQRFVRALPTGERVFERRVPVGVIGAVFEARPNVTIDVASQVLKARSAAVLRTGAAALGSATALVELVIAPSLREHGAPAEAVQLVPTPGHAGADALVGLPDLVPLVVVRGSGEVTRRLSALGAAAGTRVLAHADGGGVLYLDAERGRRRRGADDPRQHGPARRLQPAQPAADRPRRARPALARRRARLDRARPDPEPAAARPPRSAMNGRWTPATRRT